MASDIKAYRVFVASPGGLGHERRAFHETITAYNESDALKRGALFIPVGWEMTLGGVGRPQSFINEDVRSSDYFVLLLWDRWGSPPQKEGAGTYTSGTEEEYDLAMGCFRNPDLPMRQVVVFFKAVDPRQVSDPGEQLAKVLEFKKSLESGKELTFETFDEIDVFKDRLRCYLAQWLRDHEEGTDAKVRRPEPPPSPRTPESLTPTLRDEDHPAVAAARSELVEEGRRLADEGRLTDAEACLARAVARGDDPNAFNAYGMFLLRLGRLAQAEAMYDRVIELGAERADLEVISVAYTNLGNVFLTRGDLDRGEEMYRKALEIDEQRHWPEGMACDYGNLGLIYQTRGDLDRAEEMHRKALAIDEKLGGLEGMAADYGNLGLIYQTRADLDRAEEMFRRALDIAQRLGHLEGVATSYGNLGLIYQARGDLDRADETHRKALEIDEKLGHLEGVGRHYGNLGLIYKTRGDLHEAERMLRKSLEMNEKLGRLEGVGISYGNLGLICQTRGDLDEAERMHRKALEIDDKLGRLEGMAANYGNLGTVFEARGDLDGAEEMYRKSLAIEEKLGRLEGMANACGNLGSVFEARGEGEQARELWVKARELFERIGMPHEVEKLQRLLDDLSRPDAPGD